MEERRTRKFLKPIRGNAELRKFSQHFAQVRYFLQGWQDFLDNGSPWIRDANGSARLSGMDGEITLTPEDRTRIAVEEILGQEFTLHIDQDHLYEIVVYKLKDNNPDNGRYSVRCKICY